MTYGTIRSITYRVFFARVTQKLLHFQCYIERDWDDVVVNDDKGEEIREDPDERLEGRLGRKPAREMQGFLLRM